MVLALTVCKFCRGAPFSLEVTFCLESSIGLTIRLFKLFGLLLCLFWLLVWLFPQGPRPQEDPQEPFPVFFSKMAPVASWMRRAINGAVISPHNATTMATAVEALGAEFSTPRKAANEAGAVARDSPVHAAR